MKSAGTKRNTAKATRTNYSFLRNNTRLANSTRKILKNVRNHIKNGKTLNRKITNYIRRSVANELNTKGTNVYKISTIGRH